MIAITMISSTSVKPDFAFFRGCVQPIFVNPRPGMVGCTQCHNAEFARPIPAGQQTWSEQDSRRAFNALLNYIDAGHPEYSRFLHKPLHPDAGGDLMHNGGRRWQSKDDPEWRALAAWVRAAAPSGGTAAGAASPLDFEFFRTRIQPMFQAKRAGLVRCTQCHSRGTGSGLTLAPLAEGAKDWNEEQSRKNFAVVSGLVVPGDPTASRLLMHPLARDAGGDPFHGGGKHWSSQSDPEWQTLAAWVRGATASR